MRAHIPGIKQETSQDGSSVGKDKVGVEKMGPALDWQSQESFLEVLGQQDWEKRQERLLSSSTLEAGRASETIWLNPEFLEL